MKEWKHHCGILIKEEPYMNNLLRYSVYRGEKLLGSVYPLHVDNMEWLVAELDKGGCPICDNWEKIHEDKCQWKEAAVDPFSEEW